MRALRERGIAEHAFAEFRTLDPQVILDTCEWFDQERRKRTIGPGVLVEELRGGGRTPEKRRPSSNDEQRDYGEQIVDWLREHFPQWNREEGNRTHTAAIARVIRRGRLSVREHGPEIREAVARFEAQYGSAGEER